MTSVDATGENEERNDQQGGMQGEDQHAPAAPTPDSPGETGAEERDSSGGDDSAGSSSLAPGDSSGETAAALDTGAANAADTTQAEDNSSSAGSAEGGAAEGGQDTSGEPSSQDVEASSPYSEEDDQASGNAMQLLFEDLLRAMGVQGTIRIKDNTRDQVTLEILNCPDASLIIGRHGQTVDDLQYLGGLILNNNRRDRKRFMLNVENYRERREETLRNSAIALARQVAEYGQEAVLDPLPPHERRIVHLAVVDIPEVYTYSEGQEPDRRIVISPRHVSGVSPDETTDGASPEAGSGAADETAGSNRDLDGEPLVGVDNAAFAEGELGLDEPDLRGETEFGLAIDPAQGAGDALEVAAEAAAEKASEPVTPPDLDEAAAGASEKASEPVELPATPAGGGSHDGHTGVDAAD